ncbi:hypothetical protein RFI_25425, partial [Reticulomyxa filosa]
LQYNQSQRHSKPTHFLAIRIKNPLIFQLAKALQEQFEEKYPSMNTSMVDLSSMHITLNVFYLENTSLLEKCMGLLACIEKWINKCIEETLRHSTAKAIEETEINALSEKEGDNCMKDTVTNPDEMSIEQVVFDVVKSLKFTSQFKDLYQKVCFQSSANFVLSVRGVNHFDRKVVYLDFSGNSVSIQIITLLHRLIQVCSTQLGLKIAKENTFNPHCTLCKLSKLSKQQSNTLLQTSSRTQTKSDINCKTLDHSIFDESVRGVFSRSNVTNIMDNLIAGSGLVFEEFVTDIGLCEMGRRNKDEYYQIVKNITISTDTFRSQITK